MHRYLAYVQTGLQVVGFYDTEPLTFKKWPLLPIFECTFPPVNAGAMGIRQEINTMYSQYGRGVETQPMKEAEEIHLDFERPWSPAMDVRVCDGQIIVYADLPGLDEGAIRVEEKNGSLYILGERTFDHDEHCQEFVQVERFYGAFEGRVSLPARADVSQLVRDYENGVLRLTVPVSRE